ncbi:hypothetical protein [Methylorubrum aminovorans]
MNGPLAAELNGLLLKTNESHEVWLVMLGSRHHVASSDVYNSLFRADTKIVEVSSVDHIRRGFDICDDSLLAKSINSGKIFLVVRDENRKVGKYYITTFETFTEFGFDMNKVKEFPDILIDAITETQEIRSY